MAAAPFQYAGKNFSYCVVGELDSDREFWFKANDVTDYLGLKQTSHAIQNHVSVENSRHWCELKNVMYPGLPKNIQSHSLFISEAGLFELLCYSKTPKCKVFLRWLCTEGLASLREQWLLHSENKPTLVQPESLLEMRQCAEQFNQSVETVHQSLQLVQQCLQEITKNTQEVTRCAVHVSEDRQYISQCVEQVKRDKEQVRQFLEQTREVVTQRQHDQPSSPEQQTTNTKPIRRKDLLVHRLKGNTFVFTQRLKESITTVLRTMKDTKPNAVLLYRCHNVPNDLNIVQQFTDMLNKAHISYVANYKTIKIKKTMTDQEIVQKVKAILGK